MNSFSVISFLNELELICLCTIFAIVSTLLNGFYYCSLTLKIQFDINHLFSDCEMVTAMVI